VCQGDRQRSQRSRGARPHEDPLVAVTPASRVDGTTVDMGFDAATSPPT
jgi:hypothetical protein